MLKLCKTCANEFDGRRNSQYCPSCLHTRKIESRRRWYDKHRKSKKAATRACVVCGREIFCPPSKQSHISTCSGECARIRRQKHILNHSDLEIKRLAGLQASPKTGKYDTHIHAKNYQITTPKGEIISCRNLRNWTREHAHEYGYADDKLYNGFMYAIGRKRKTNIRGEIEWKDWIIIESNDDE